MNYLFDEPEYSYDQIDINLAFNDEDGDLPVITNQLELFLQEIYIALMVGPGEIWGVKDSIELSRYLFNRHITTNFINAEVTTYIGYHCSQASNFKYSIMSEFMVLDDSQSEVVVIHMKIETDNRDNEPIIKSFVLGQE